MSIFRPILIASVVFFSNSFAFANNASPKWCEADKLTKVEQVICDDNVLATSDILMASLYKEIMSYRGKEGHEGHWPGEIISNQRDWVKERNATSKRVKLLDLYMTRIQELHLALQNRLRAKP